jgi:two-component system, NtrC family, sensor kinase
MRRGAKPREAEVEAKLPDARKSRTKEGSRDRQPAKRLAEALEQQTATSEILRVISSSPADAQPVFDAIAVNALRLCDAKGAVVVRYDGELLHLAARHNVDPEAVDQIERRFPEAPDRHLPMGRAVLDGAVVHVPDFQAAAEFSGSVARQRGARSHVSIPLLHRGRAIGAIGISRPTLGPFSDQQIALLQTFAAQAVIAIENARLFNETKEALEQQTATSEILQVISRSATDVQPVFDTIAQSARRLCEAQFCHLFQFDGELLHFAAHHGLTPEGVDAVRQGYPMAPGRGSAAARCVLSGAVEHIPDVHADLEYRHGAIAKVVTSRSNLAVPMLRDGVPIGAVVVARSQAGLFPDKQIELLKTFADQAVIAIENVRLFKELEARNRDLTATSEILRVISSSPTDTQPVFEAIVRSAQRLSGAYSSVLSRLVDGELQLAASSSTTPSGDEALGAMYPLRLTQAPLLAQAIGNREPLLIEDTETDPRITPLAREIARQRGYRSTLQLPLTHRDGVIGVIAVSHAQPRAFTRDEIELVKTFADQAVIAIENVRLFKELEARNRELTEALDQQTATSEILRVISRSQTDVQPVFDAIVASAVRLLRGYSGTLARLAGDQIELTALTSTDAAGDAALRAAFPLSLQSGGMHAQAIRDRAPLNIADAHTDPRVPEASRARARVRGYRSGVAVPLLRHDEAIGAIAVSRREAGGFSDDEIALLQTFADQAVIAIENVRLFREIADKSRQLEVASQHKSEFLANMSHELRTPLNAIIGFSEVLGERMFGELNEKQAEYLKDIYASGTHLLSLINDILDLSKIEAGRMELDLTDFDLPTALDNAMMLVRERAARRSITLEKSVDERLGQIRADERKVRQVVLNLLSNAIKFTPEGGRIEVRAVPGDGLVEVSISDTGVGIAPEDQVAVFEEFRQVGASAAKQEGTGLGLALCRKFVELHGGKIRVQSEVGRGSTFTFRLPMRCEE